MELTGTMIDDDIEETELANHEPIAYMLCGYCETKIKCPTISEAEQRARLHSYNTAHNARWEFQ